MSNIEIYKHVLTGKISRFPSHFWSPPLGRENAVEITRFLFEQILQWTDEDIKKRLRSETFYKYKLRGMLGIVYNGSPYAAINSVYPERFKPWELNMSPLNTWNEQVGIDAVKWLVEEKLKWDDETIKKEWSRKAFIDHGLKGLLTVVYDESPFKAIDAAYHGKFKPWEFKKTPQSFWDMELAKNAVRWLVEEKLQISGEEARNTVKYNTFVEHGLAAMLNTYFNCSPHEAITSVYSEETKLKKSDN